MHYSDVIHLSRDGKGYVYENLVIRRQLMGYTVEDGTLSECHICNTLNDVRAHIAHIRGMYICGDKLFDLYEYKSTIRVGEPLDVGRLFDDFVPMIALDTCGNRVSVLSSDYDPSDHVVERVNVVGDAFAEKRLEVIVKDAKCSETVFGDIPENRWYTDVLYAVKDIVDSVNMLDYACPAMHKYNSAILGGLVELWSAYGRSISFEGKEWIDHVTLEDDKRRLDYFCPYSFVENDHILELLDGDGYTGLDHYAGKGVDGLREAVFTACDPSIVAFRRGKHEAWITRD